MQSTHCVPLESSFYVGPVLRKILDAQDLKPFNVEVNKEEGGSALAGRLSNLGVQVAENGERK